MPVANIRPPVDFLSSVESIVMKPSFGLYPQSLGQRGIKFGTELPVVSRLAMAVYGDVSAPTVTYDAETKTYRGKYHGRYFSQIDHKGKGLLAEIHRMEERLLSTPDQFIGNEKLMTCSGQSVPSMLRSSSRSYQKRMERLGGLRFSEIIAASREKKPRVTASDFVWLAEDLALAARVCEDRCGASVDLFFLSGMLYFSSRRNGNSSRASSMFEQAARLAFAADRKPLVALAGEYALSLHIPDRAVVRPKLSNLTTRAWNSSSSLGQKFSPWLFNIAMFHGLVISLYEEDWSQAARFYERTAGAGQNRIETGRNYVRGMWALARYIAESGNHSAWKKMDSMLEKALDAWTGSQKMKGESRKLMKLQPIVRSFVG